MLEPAAVEAIAERLRTAQDANTQLAPISAEQPGFDVDSAYAVAHAIHRTRIRDGAVAVGRKIGFTNRGMWDEYGVRQPIWGYLYDASVVCASAGRSRCRISRYAEPKIEPEIVLHFAAAPPVQGDLAAIIAAVDWVAHGFEIVQSRFPAWKFAAADTIADAALHAALIIGERRPVSVLGADPAATLERFAITLACNGEIRDQGSGVNVLGSPLAAIRHLMTALSTQPNAAPLATGECVTTGSLTAAQPIRPGEIWHTTLDGIDLPGLQLEVTP